MSEPKTRRQWFARFGGNPGRRQYRSDALATLYSQGEPLVWLSGGALVLSLSMLAWIVGSLVYFGLGTFWPPRLMDLKTTQGQVLIGELVSRENGRLLVATSAADSRPGEQWIEETDIESLEPAPYGIIVHLRDFPPVHGLFAGVQEGPKSNTDLPAAWQVYLQWPDPAVGKSLIVDDGNGNISLIQPDEIEFAYLPNQLSIFGKLSVFLRSWGGFFVRDPDPLDGSFGVRSALAGTVVLTLLMTVLVIPFGVLAALYLHEYAPTGVTTSLVRVAVNNLAGVPGIVFGVFGLGFFCYVLGASLDQLFFAEDLPNPTFAKGGLLWAALTLALLTLPVVIVATEESLEAVPRSLREASFACGSSRWQTIWRIVLPRALPGVLTGAILAIARGAGEVAPLLLVGAVKHSSNLPLDTDPPYLHLERGFMHLGYQVFDLGFPNDDASTTQGAAAMTALVLIALVLGLNLLAILLRGRLRRHLAIRGIE